MIKDVKETMDIQAEILVTFGTIDGTIDVLLSDFAKDDFNRYEEEK